MAVFRVVCLFALLLWAVASLGAETVDFDHGWKFRYFGKNVPAETSKIAKADSVQNGHPASAAVDGNRTTRWCANDGKPGHNITISVRQPRKVETVRIVWENDRTKQVVVELAAKTGKARRKISTQGNTSDVAVGGRVLNSVVIRVNGTGDGNWASIYEVELLDAEGHILPIADSSPDCPDEAKLKFDDSAFRSVQLPHDWAIESRFLPEEPNETGKLPWVGYGWYRREFRLREDFDPEKQRYYLDFDGVMANPQIYVNGHKAGEWAYGYMPFRVDMTPYLRAGQTNVVAVRVHNLPLSTRWYPGAGIYRHVTLERTQAVHLARWGVYVTTPDVSDTAATLNIETTICNTSKTDVVLSVQQQVEKSRVLEREVRVPAGEEYTLQQTLQLPNPRLWSCSTPNLYKLNTTIKQGTKVLESRVTSFGVRTIDWRPDGFYLNGERVYLKGVCEHHDLGPLGAAFHSRGYERKIEILKSMGCNSIRMTHNPPAREVLELCDRHGMLVIDELFDIWKAQKYDKKNGYHVLWPDWWKRDVRNFMLRDRNHPCIIAWSGGNEVPEMARGDGAEVSAALRDEMQKYDSTRPFTAGNNELAARYNGFGDTQGVYGFNYKPSHYREYGDNRPNMPFYASETASCVGTRGVYVFPLRWGKDGGYVGEGSVPFQVSAYGLSAPGWANCPDVEFAAQDANPRVAGEYVWTGFDYIGEPTPYNQDPSIENNFKHLSPAERKKKMAEFAKLGNKAPSRSSYFGIIDLAGLPKDTYYLYQSRWKPELKQAHLLPHWNWPDRKGKVTPVMCFSSGDEAELFLNGKSQGIRRKGEGPTFNQSGVTVSKNGYRFVWEDVRYEPGELHVVVRKDGKPWAEAKRSTTGRAARVKAEADRSTISGDGRDLSYVTLSVLDSKGRVVPTDCRKVRFKVTGAAEFAGACNGNPIDHTCMQDEKQRFFNGHIVVVLRGKRKAEGKAVLQVQADSLPPVELNINVE